MDPHGFTARMARKVVAFGRRRLFEGEPFTSPLYRAYTKARLEHLASLDLDISKKNVLEVDAGIGMLTKFFEERSCTVLSTDGNPRNVKAMQSKYAWRKVELLDLDRTSDI
jgi:2-polyprenyl-3-methyl-5-hydroxy-6-metoxy-1,4-benzoquinol methylase